MRGRLLALLLLVLPGLASAQEDSGMASLVADSVVVTADGRLVASGDVEAFHEGTTLSAARITYDRAAGRLSIEGPILIREPGGAVLAAESADLDPQLRDGLLRGARLVRIRGAKAQHVHISEVARLGVVLEVGRPHDRHTRAQVQALAQVRAALVQVDRAVVHLAVRPHPVGVVP